MTGPDLIHVNFNNLQVAADTLVKEAGTLNSEMEALKRNVEPLRQSWAATGSSAGEAYDAAEKKLQALINDYILTIQKFGAKVHEARETQMVVEQANTNRFM